MNNVQLAVQFFLQIAVILLACRVVGRITRNFGQPQVVAEMITGVLLGPSFLGWLAPEWQRALFPWDGTQSLRDTQSYLFPASQLGLALYMFVVGMEFRGDLVRRHFRCALAVSAAGMIAPFMLGGALGWVLHSHTGLFPEHTSLPNAMLFLGASMCITAFPMLARIIQHKGLSGTIMGTVAISAGAIDDATAWCLLAVVLAGVHSNHDLAATAIVGAAGFVAVAMLVVRPLMKRAESLLTRDGELTESGFAIALALMALGAWWTDKIGLHAVFGSFVMGASMPRGVVTRDMITRVQPLTVAILLPLFFTYSGLNTRIGLLDTAWLWLICTAVLLCAILGKGGGCWSAARACGLPNREALGIGTLMNARGLMELIIINIGLQQKIISPALFAMLVVMAVVTTLMTSPIFDRLFGGVPLKSDNPPHPD